MIGVFIWHQTGAPCICCVLGIGIVRHAIHAFTIAPLWGRYDAPCVCCVDVLRSCCVAPCMVHSLRHLCKNGAILRVINTNICTIFL